MALLAVKNALFPSSRDQNSRAPLYRRVSYADDDDDLEPGTGNARSKSSNEKETDSVFSDSSSRFDARYVSDATIGLSDGLTVPFALTAGLSALGDSKVVIIGGLAELIAGSISMGLGGYLGARSEAFVSSAQSADVKACQANKHKEKHTRTRSTRRETWRDVRLRRHRQ